MAKRSPAIGDGRVPSCTFVTSAVAFLPRVPTGTDTGRTTNMTTGFYERNVVSVHSRQGTLCPAAVYNGSGTATASTLGGNLDASLKLYYSSNIFFLIQFCFKFELNFMKLDRIVHQCVTMIQCCDLKRYLCSRLHAATSRAEHLLRSLSF